MKNCKIKIEDIIGKKYYRLTIVGEIEDKIYHRYGRDIRVRRIVCQCECGNLVNLQLGSFGRSKYKSCGCLKNEMVRQRIKKYNTTHGESKSRLHSKWASIKERCNNPKCKSFQDYGGRGIKLESYFDDYVNFRNYVMSLPNYDKVEELKLTLDRIDNEKGYERGNLRWVDRKRQNRNKRTNRLITYKGDTMCLKDWSENMGIPYSTLSRRVNSLNWNIYKAIETPVKKK